MRALMIFWVMSGWMVFSVSVVASQWEDNHREQDGDDKKNWQAKGMKDSSSGFGMMMGGDDGGHMTARLRAVWSLNLNAEQKSVIRKLQRQLREKHWQLEDKVEDISDKLFELYHAAVRDAVAIGKVYGEMFDYRRQIIEEGIKAGNQVEAALTPKQRASLKKHRSQHKWGGGWDE